MCNIVYRLYQKSAILGWNRNSKKTIGKLYTLPASFFTMGNVEFSDNRKFSSVKIVNNFRWSLCESLYLLLINYNGDRQEYLLRSNPEICMSAASLFKDLKLVTEQWGLTLASCMRSDAMYTALCSRKSPPILKQSFM